MGSKFRFVYPQVGIEADFWEDIKINKLGGMAESPPFEVIVAGPSDLPDVLDEKEIRAFVEGRAAKAQLTVTFQAPAQHQPNLSVPRVQQVYKLFITVAFKR